MLVIFQTCDLYCLVLPSRIGDGASQGSSVVGRVHPFGLRKPKLLLLDPGAPAKGPTQNLRAGQGRALVLADSDPSFVGRQGWWWEAPGDSRSAAAHPSPGRAG